MKETMLLFLSFFIINLSVVAQITIQNPSFEDWEIIDGNEFPEGWEYAETMENFGKIEKIEDSTVGTFYPRIQAYANGFAEGSVTLSQKISVQILPTLFSFSYKNMSGSNTIILKGHHQEDGWVEILFEYLPRTEEDFELFEYIVTDFDKFEFDSVEIKFKTTSFPLPDDGPSLAYLSMDDVKMSYQSSMVDLPGYNISSLFPNPASDFLYMEHFCLTESARYRIFDIHGRLIDDLNYSCEGRIIEIPLTHYAPGTYFIQTCYEDCILNVRRFVVAP